MAVGECLLVDGCWYGWYASRVMASSWGNVYALMCIPPTYDLAVSMPNTGLAELPGSDCLMAVS